jgi:hypothetical protein
MKEAYVLVETRVGQSEAVAEAVHLMLPWSRVELVRGPYDLVIRAFGTTLQDIRRETDEGLRTHPAVTRAILCPITARVPEVLEPIAPEPFDVSVPEPAFSGSGLVGAGVWGS